MYMHLYVSEDGVVRDRDLEQLFFDLYHSRVTAATKKAFSDYVKYCISGDIDIPVNIFEDAKSCIEFILTIGGITLWIMDDEDREYNPDFPRDRIFYGCLYGEFDDSALPCFAETLHKVVLLSFVDSMRRAVDKNYKLDRSGNPVKH